MLFLFFSYQTVCFILTTVLFPAGTVPTLAFRAALALGTANGC